MQKIDLPSGAHLRPEGAIGNFESCRASPPSGAMTWICATSPPRFDTKAMVFESGDQAGPEFLPLNVVSWRFNLPSVANSHRSELLSLSSIEYLVTSMATHLPSGEIAGLPRRWTFQRSSTVMGRLVCAAAGATDATMTTSATKRLIMTIRV